MAIGTPTERKAFTAQAGLTSSPFTIHPASTVAAGSVLFLFFTSGANKQVTAVTDSPGNTWVVDHVATDATRAISVASCQAVTAISAADNINITLSNTTSSTADYSLQEVTGLATSSVFDKSNDGSGSGTAVATSATATLSQAAEIAWGVFRTSAGSATWTKGTGYSDPTTNKTTTTSALEYQIVSATTALSATGTFGTSGSWAGTVVTYKGATAAVTVTVPGAAVATGAGNTSPAEVDVVLSYTVT